MQISAPHSLVLINYESKIIQRVPLSLQFITCSGMSPMSPKWPPVPGFSWSAGTLSDAAHCSISHSKRLPNTLCSWELTALCADVAILCMRFVFWDAHKCVLQCTFLPRASGPEFGISQLRMVNYCVCTAVHLLTSTIVSMVSYTIHAGHDTVGHVQKSETVSTTVHTPERLCTAKLWEINDGRQAL